MAIMFMLHGEMAHQGILKFY